VPSHVWHSCIDRGSTDEVCPIAIKDGAKQKS